MKKNFQIISFCLLITLVITNNLFAQWTHLGPSDYNQPSYDAANFTSIAVDGNGNTYVAFQDGGLSLRATVSKYNGSNWDTVGMRGFSIGEADYTSIAIDGSGTPYIVYSDYGINRKAVVKKFNGSDWVLVGNAGFSIGFANYCQIALDGSGTPYVVYSDYGNSSKATVMKFNGSNWVEVGSGGFSTGYAEYTSIDIDGNGIPYVVFRDDPHNYSPTVMKFNGISWDTVGVTAFMGGNDVFCKIAIDGNNVPYVVTPDQNYGHAASVYKFNGTNWVLVGAGGFSIVGGVEYTSIKFDGSNTPYVVFMGDYGKPTVMKFDGNVWINVGTPGFSNESCTYTDIAIDGNGAPYIVYCFNSNLIDNKARVYKFDGSNWNLLGTRGIYDKVVYQSSVAIDPNGIPYIAIGEIDNNSDGKATVLKYNGTNWDTIGNTQFTPNHIDQISIAFDGSGALYVCFDNGSTGWKANVMKFNGSSWVSVGNPDFSAGNAEGISFAIDNNGTPYVCYQDYVNNYGATVVKFDGSSWNPVGSTDFTTGLIDVPSMAIDNNGTPYVVFQDSSGLGGKVMKFNGSNWELVGNSGYTAGACLQPKMAFDNLGTPYIAFQDNGNSWKLTVMKYNGVSWINVGNPGFSDDVADKISLAINSNGTPYVAFKERTLNYIDGIAKVMKFNGANWVNISNSGLSSGYVTSTSIAIHSNGTPLVAYSSAGAFVCGATCSADFLLYPDTSQLHHYIIINNATGNGSLQYVWNWGDGTYDYTAYPSHTYLDTGIYTICLSITDSTGCQSTFCDSSYHVQRTSNMMAYVNVYSNILTSTKTLGTNNSINIYPNPTDNILNVVIENKNIQELILEVDNLMGQKEIELNLKNAENILSLNISSLSTGCYFIKLISKDKISVAKFIKM